MNDFNDGAGDRVRIGDAERDGAAAALGEHYSEGRLDRVEFDARLADALAARTRHDLAVLFTDLVGFSSWALTAGDAAAAATPISAAPRCSAPRVADR